MKPPFPYHGGKSRMAPWIASHIPAHETYVEPFAGSSAVLFYKRQAAVEILNDLDRAVWAFFTALREDPDELARLCRMSPYSRAEFASCRVGVDEGDISVLERARRFFVTISQAFGSVPTSTGWSAPAPASPEASKVQTLTDRFAPCAQRLRLVHLECRPALDVLRAYDSADTAFYVDPPYLGETRSWAAVQSHKQDYRREMTQSDEHVELLEALVDCRGAVLLSGKRSELYDTVLTGWCSVDGPDGEVLWSNRPIVEHLSLF